ncbi:hypothetical protein QC764_200499 [Podospora pseudoanserina]|uniref:Uncharacterized protein n=1 Tax=Podospora pseudoanserina TaxID=2609844 RepID=A0ABR0IFH0_9PEZI|nr:hypothetical protein QC764_200499 [Podospora pseudoanserina]
MFYSRKPSPSHPSSRAMGIGHRSLIIRVCTRETTTRGGKFPASGIHQFPSEHRPLHQGILKPPADGSQRGPFTSRPSPFSLTTSPWGCAWTTLTTPTTLLLRHEKATSSESRSAHGSATCAGWPFRHSNIPPWLRSHVFHHLSHRPVQLVAGFLEFTTRSQPRTHYH